MGKPSQEDLLAKVEELERQKNNLVQIVRFLYFGSPISFDDGVTAGLWKENPIDYLQISEE